MQNELQNNMNDPKAEQRLKIFSGCFIFLAVLDVLILIFSYLAGEMDMTYTSDMANVSPALVTGIFVVLILISLTATFFKLYLGIKGLNQIKGTARGTFYLKLAKFAMVLMIIAAVLNLMSAIGGSGDWIEVCNNIVSVCILYGYMNAAKAVRANQEAE